MKRTKIKTVCCVVAMLFAMTQSVFAASISESIFFPDSTVSVPKEVMKHQPETLLEDVEPVEKGEKFSLLESGYHTFFRQFNFLNPSPLGAAASGVDAGMDLLFDRLGDQSPKLREEEYRLRKARWGYEWFLKLFPSHQKVGEVKEHITRLSERIAELDKELNSDVVVIPEAKRPTPKDWTWVLAGDNWLKDLGSAAPAFAFAGPGAIVGIGLFEGISIATRGYQLASNGGLSNREHRIEIEYLAAEARIASGKSKPLCLMRLARAYEAEGSVPSLMKALAIYTKLQAEGITEPDAKEYLGKADMFKEHIAGVFKYMADRFEEVPEDFENPQSERTEKKTEPAAETPYASHTKRTRERIAEAIKAYAEEYGNRQMLASVAEEFPETEAGKEAAEFLESGEELEARGQWKREVTAGASTGASGFDVYGSGYNLFGEGQTIGGGIKNGADPYGNIQIPWMDKMLGGRTPEIRVGPNRFSLVLNPEREKPHKDNEFFSR